MTTGRYTHPHAYVAAAMVDSARRWLASLDGGQRSKAAYHYLDGERIFWYYPPLNRHGLPLRDMDEHQRALALELLATGLTEDANRQARLIIEHEDVLGPLEAEWGQVTWPRDPQLYYWTVFGEPGRASPRVRRGPARRKPSSSTAADPGARSPAPIRLPAAPAHPRAQ